MMERCITVCGAQSTVAVLSASVPRASGPKIFTDGNAAELQVGQGISIHGVMGCSNVLSGGVSQVHDNGGRRALGHGKPSGALRRVRAANKLENEREESVSGSSSVAEKKKKNSGVKEEEVGFVEKVEAEMGRQFGGVLWFSVLLVSLAVFGGAYAFLIVQYADLSDIPILRGPQR